MLDVLELEIWKERLAAFEQFAPRASRARRGKPLLGKGEADS